MKIKDFPGDKSLENVKFKHPETGETCIWKSQWGYTDGAAGVWYGKPGDENPDRIYPIFLDKLEEALEWELVDGQDDP